MLRRLLFRSSLCVGILFCLRSEASLHLCASSVAADRTLNSARGQALIPIGSLKIPLEIIPIRVPNAGRQRGEHTELKIYFNGQEMIFPVQDSSKGTYHFRSANEIIIDGRGYRGTFRVETAESEHFRERLQALSSRNRRKFVDPQGALCPNTAYVSVFLEAAAIEGGENLQASLVVPFDPDLSPAHQDHVRQEELYDELVAASEDLRNDLTGSTNPGRFIPELYSVSFKANGIKVVGSGTLTVRLMATEADEAQALARQLRIPRSYRGFPVEIQTLDTTAVAR